MFLDHLDKSISSVSWNKYIEYKGKMNVCSDKDSLEASLSAKAWVLHPPFTLSLEFASVFDLPPICHQILNFHRETVFPWKLYPQLFTKLGNISLDMWQSGQIYEMQKWWPGENGIDASSQKILHQLFLFWDPESGWMTKCTLSWMKPSTNYKKAKNASTGKYLLTPLLINF